MCGPEGTFTTTYKFEAKLNPDGSEVRGRCQHPIVNSSAPPAWTACMKRGGVEGEIGRFRRRHLTPVPHVGSLAALNKALAAADARDDTAGSAPGSRPSGRPPPAQLSVGVPGG